ncbi:MAG: DUF6435 family protein [Arenicella sp.]
MLSFFNKNPKEKLNKQYLATLEKAMQAQRNGDIKSYSTLTANAEKILKQIDAL